MIKPRVALFTFLEGHQREKVYQARRPMALRETARLVQSLGNNVEIVQMPHAEIRGKSDIAANVQAAATANVDAVLMHIPIFVPPAMVAHAARQVTQPIALVCNEAPDTFSQLALLACAGALDQIGIRYRRIPGNLDDTNLAELLAYLCAAAVATRLKGMTFGAIGGCSLGISTGTADPALWECIFLSSRPRHSRSRVCVARVTATGWARQQAKPKRAHAIRTTRDYSPDHSSSRG